MSYFAGPPKKAAGATTQPATMNTTAVDDRKDNIQRSSTFAQVVGDLLPAPRNIREDKWLADLAQWDSLAKHIRHYRQRALRRRAEGKTAPLDYLLKWRDAEREADSWWWERCRFLELMEADWIDYHPGKRWGDAS